MDHNIYFHKSPFRADSEGGNETVWERVLQAHKQGDYPGVIRGIVDYAGPKLAARYGNADKTAFSIPHGSTVLHLGISGSEFTVKAPFLDISESKKIPLMRRVAELNFSPLNLASVQLQGDRLEFGYTCPLALCEPYKLYDVLREICVYADSYDDEFIHKFGAKPLSEPQVERYPREMLDKAWEHTQYYIEEARKGIAWFESKRAFNLAWDLIAITIMQIEYYIQPQGMLRTDIEKMLGYLIDETDLINTKVSRGKAFLNKLAGYDRAAFNADLYRVQTFIPFKVRSTEQALRSQSVNTYDQARRQMEAGDHLGATISLLYHFFDLFYQHDVPPAIARRLEKALTQASGKPWNEASFVLFKAMNRIMAAPLVPYSRPGSGIFSRIMQMFRP